MVDPADSEKRVPGRDLSPAGDALHELLYEVAFTHFRVQAAFIQRGPGALTPGQVSMLRSLALEGPQTVPTIASARPVARQPVQRMAVDLCARGLTTFETNPNHRRSRLLTLTPAGRRVYARIERAQRASASRLAGRDLGERRLRDATRLLRKISGRVLADGD